MSDTKLKNVTAAAHIAAQLRKEIASFDASSATEERGVVRDVGDGVVSIAGLASAKSLELITFENGTVGVVLNLEHDRVGAMILGEWQGIKAGDNVTSTGQILSILSNS